MKMFLIGVYQAKPGWGDSGGHWFLRMTDPDTNQHSDAALFEAQARQFINSGIPQLPDGGGNT